MIKLKNILFEISDSLKKQFMDKVRKSGYSLTDEQFKYYIDAFERNRENRIFPSKDIFSYTYQVDDENRKQFTFKYLENLIDQNFSRETMSKAEINTRDDKDIIYNQNGIVIWDADTKQKCIKYGKPGNNYCVARNDSSNMFNSYRYQNRLTFYFVLDKTKRESDPFSFFSIAVTDGTNINDKTKEQYYVTDRDNEINKLKSWDFIISKNKNIENLQGLFKPKPLSKKEYQRYERFKYRISDEEYKPLNYDDKLFYIQMGHFLTTDMFKSSNTQLQDVYIQTGNPNLEDLEHLFSNSQKKLFAKTLVKKVKMVAEQNGWKKNIFGKYNAESDVQIDDNLIYKGKLLIKFGKVNGSVDIYSKKLKSLEGVPEEVGGSFYCSNTKITSLKGAPEKVGGDFNCSDCELLESLEGAPNTIGGSFNCSDCELLESLEGTPNTIGGSFYCYGCESLVSLEGTPKILKGGFSCGGCESLETLKGAPHTVGDYFDCSNCTKLESLEGAPIEIGSYFSCRNCVSLKSLKGAPNKIFKAFFDCSWCDELESLQGAPEEVGGNFNCYHCKSLESLYGAPKKVILTFNCNNCTKLESLEGAPKEVGGSFNCSNTKITSLEGAPEKVGGDFNCSDCDSLKSLNYLPKASYRLVPTHLQNELNKMSWRNV